MGELKKLQSLYKENKKAFWLALFDSCLLASVIVVQWTIHAIRTAKLGEYAEQSYVEKEMYFRNALGGIIAKSIIFFTILTLFFLASQWPFKLGRERFSFHRWIIKRIKERFHRVDEEKQVSESIAEQGTVQAKVSEKEMTSTSEGDSN